MGEGEEVLMESGDSRNDSGRQTQNCWMGSSYLTVGTLAGLSGPRAVVIPEWV